MRVSSQHAAVAPAEAPRCAMTALQSLLRLTARAQRCAHVCRSIRKGSTQRACVLMAWCAAEAQAALDVELLLQAVEVTGTADMEAAALELLTAAATAAPQLALDKAMDVVQLASSSSKLVRTMLPRVCCRARCGKPA